MENERIENIVYDTIGAMIEVHKNLGPGYQESFYQRALEIELKDKQISFETEKEIEIRYKENFIGSHRLDLLIENVLIVELKTVESLGKKHYAQVLSYLKATQLEVALLVNFSDYSLDPRKIVY